jgi:peptidyl-prolyl cis-trans isomerase A (cyclophilin A)
MPANVAFLLLTLLALQDDPARQTADLIEKLRSDDIDVREEAAKKLKAIGKPAIPELEKAAKETDSELAERAKAILKAIAAGEDPLHDAPAPAEFKAVFATSQGDFKVKVTRAWAPLGADRFHNLVKSGYYDNCRFFRVIAGFMCQFGINGDPVTSAKWKAAKIEDDPVIQGNKRGRITFAMAGPNSRTTQLFINFKDNDRLDGMGFASFGEVVEGMDVVDKLYSGYGEGAPRGNGPTQARIQTEGNKYLEEDFEKLDYIKSAKILK